MTFTQADIERARSEGAQQEHERIATILSHPRAETNPQAARTMILTGVKADQVGRLFDAMPQGTAPTGVPILEALDKLFGTDTRH